jgi:hypothetical protein
MPAFVTLCVVRAAISECRSGGLRASEVTLGEEIAAKCRSRLQAAGFELQTFRITALEIRPAGQVADGV